MKCQRLVNDSFSACRRFVAGLWLLPLASLGLLLSAAAVHAQPVPDRDTLLIVQFDSSVRADYSLGSPTTSSGSESYDG